MLTWMPAWKPPPKSTGSLSGCWWAQAVWMRSRDVMRGKSVVQSLKSKVQSQKSEVLHPKSENDCAHAHNSGANRMSSRPLQTLDFRLWTLDFPEFLLNQIGRAHV